MTSIIGSGGGGGGGGGGKGGGGRSGGGSSRTPRTAPDSLDSRQYANVIDLISEGEIEGLVDGNKSIFLNSTPLENASGDSNFEDVTIYTRNGTQTQGFIPLTTGTENERIVNRPVVQAVPIVETITDDEVDAARITISVPSLQRIDNETGDTSGTSVRLKIYVQYAGAGYVEVIDDTISGRTADLYQKAYMVTLDRPNSTDNVDIKVERITGDSTNALLSNAFSWSSITEIKWLKLTYPNSALIGLRVDAEQFNSIPSRKYLVKGVKVKIPNGVTVDSDTGRIIYPDNFVWDGTFAAATWTSCPAWILYDLLTSTRYGFGNHIDTAQLDRWSFFAASKYSNELVDDGFGGTEARFSCNTTIQTAEESFKLVNDLLSVMRCQGFWSAGSLTISQDAPQDPAYLFTSANVTEEGFSYSGSSLKTRPTVVVVSYLDIELQDIAYEVVEDQDGIAKYGVMRKEFSAFACTSRGQAARIGKWILYSDKYEKDVVTFTSSLDAGQVVRPGMVIQISDPVVAGERKAGRINAATTSSITVDDTANTDLSFGSGSTLHVILPDGTSESRLVSTIASGVITVQSNFSTTPNVNSIWMLESIGLGAASIQPTTWRVLSIDEQDQLLYTISAVSYNASKYAFVEDGEQLDQRDVTNLDIIPEPPEDLEVLETIPPGGTEPTKEVQFVLNGRVAIKITWHWRIPSGQTTKKFRVRYRHEDDNFTEVIVQGTTFDILDVKTGNYQIQVSAISGSGLLFSKPALADYTVQGLGAPPSDIVDLSLTPTTDTLAILSWDQVEELDVQLGGRIIIRHDPRALSAAEWNSSNRIVDGVSGASTQKQVPLLAGTYFVKAEDFLGNRSVNAVGYEVALPNPDELLTVKTYAEQSLSTPFSGTATNCSYDSGETALVLEPDPYVSLGYANNFYFAVDGQAEYIYKDTFDFGDVYDTIIRRVILSRPTVQTGTLFDDYPGLFDDATGFFDGTSSDAVNTVTYVRTTDDDPSGTPTWGPWTEFVAGVIQGRGVQIKAQLTTTSANINVAADQLGATLQLRRRSESGTNTTSTAAYNVTFANPFYQAPTVVITPHDLDPNDHYHLTNISTTGFTIEFVHGTGGHSIAEQFSYTATGYGRAL